MKLHFCSLNKEWCDLIGELFKDAIVTCGDVAEIPRENTVFVSPANCLGFMDGGIDMVYSRKMFPGCEKQVRDRIRSLGFKTGLGRYYFRIGSAFIVPVAETTGLICAPTMFLPHDVSATQNAYRSFLAALLVAKKAGDFGTLVVTSHCCGYGKMSITESANQMKRAYNDFVEGFHDTDTSPDDPYLVLMPSYDAEQPANFDNREIHEIN